MTHESPTESPTNTPKWQPPRGIAYEYTPGAAKPFRLRWTADGTRRSESFEHEDHREDRARGLADARKDHGKAMLTFSPAGWSEYLTAKEISHGADLRDVARAWLAGSADSSPVSTITAADAVSKYVTRRFASDIRRDTDTGRHIDLHLSRRFCGQFGNVRLSEITAEQIREWLYGITSKKTGAKHGSIAKRQHLKDLNVFFVRAIREGWVRKNPCELVDLPEVPVKDVQILTVDQAKRLLFANRKYPIAARLALEMFGGLRAASAERIQKAHIDFEAHGIRLPGGIHKGGKTLYRQGQPDVLWKWLKAAPETCWTEINEGNYGHEKVKAVVRAFGPDFTMPHNALRHSFASYLIALTGNLPNVSYLMQHTSTATTTIYEGIARRSEAKKYFAISP